ncbi:MAG: hypothetical protein ACLQLC_01660 [Candidatus Sulfotelmatobacter sp.]
MIFAATGGFLPAQQAANAAVTTVPTVTFTMDFPKSNPAHYSIAVDVSGRARYECTATIADDAEAEPYRANFEVSKANREHIFEWAKQAKYFAGKVDSGNRKLAFTGAKVLSYQDGAHSNTAQYNYSNLEPVRELTELFQKLDGTLEYGRRLAYYHRYQKLALDAELKQMEAQATNGELTEIGTVAPVLREIVEDNSVINVVRARAQELIAMGNGAGH